ncbi:MAG: methyl-coenzyme reductase alpha subunit, partial [Methanococcus sp.]|nr:methyl-coenzyme reductase alpha subunit [Methanococcus sp.]
MEAEKRLFLKALKEKFEEDPKEKYTKFYTFGGWEQSARKREFVEANEKIVSEKRQGIPLYNPDIGVPLGQRKLMPYKLSNTDDYCEGDDLHFLNNAAIQQLWD